MQIQIQRTVRYDAVEYVVSELFAKIAADTEKWGYRCYDGEPEEDLLVCYQREQQLEMLSLTHLSVFQPQPDTKVWLLGESRESSIRIQSIETSSSPELIHG